MAHSVSNVTMIRGTRPSRTSPEEPVGVHVEGAAARLKAQRTLGEIKLASGEHRVNGHQRGHHVRLAATERREAEFGQASLKNVLVVSTQR